MQSTLSIGANSNALGGLTDEQVFTLVATYRDRLVAVKKASRQIIPLTRPTLVHLKKLAEISHENINPFIGACINPPRTCILTNYCSRGSLQDILENDDIKLDRSFKISLIMDLANGLNFIHSSFLICHGHLKSTNCLVDSRWVLKISSYGVGIFRDVAAHDDKLGEYEVYRRKLWTAPEILRLEGSAIYPENGTQKGDIYSFGIILQEILCRALPFFIGMNELTPTDVIDNLKEIRTTPFRPDLPLSSRQSDVALVDLITSCWDEHPEARPSASAIKQAVLKVNHGKKINILDNMVQLLEKYASNLEEIVESRTRELVVEKKKTDSLLYQMLPESVAEQLKMGKKVEAEIFEGVTIYFSDIVGFTSLSSDSSPMQIVNLLNDLYTLFDDTIEKYDVYKVETIGDAYMVVSGVPKKNENRHVAEIASMALDLLSKVKEFKVRHRPDHHLCLRIGLHTGPCAAGVVGLTMPRYCLFGDTVNIASRMESNGQPHKIHLSSETREALSGFKGYVIEMRGQIEIKGMGPVVTYWLLDGQVVE
ncbi:hypothetical protein CAPTEDRAFT_103534 [Capitella teleta]|uniref:Guanylate cyclase n=1 Tax=Capitella teleta TaxID=283909 RepID=R7VAY3_CAPTE|nr:hypothetical protein CAPTEDRAFT_103534 [Capitella teleta]|eukprot:ELU15764.1 hypothetical protein CAPTEDRAFT_103534 [Capitella teleta]